MDHASCAKGKAKGKWKASASAPPWMRQPDADGQGDSSTRRQPEDSAPPDEWVWRAIQFGEADYAKTGTAVFDFQGTHAELGTPWIAIAEGVLLQRGSFAGPLASKEEQIISLTLWLLENGASPQALVPKTVPNISIAFTDIPEGVEKVHLKASPAGKASSTVVLELRDNARTACHTDERWKFAQQCMECLFNQMKKALAPAATAQRVTIPECILDVWERVLNRASTEGDVRLVARDNQVVRAHGFVLEEASPVLKAMLQSSMAEGQDRGVRKVSREIRVDESVAAITAFLGLLYTGSLPPERSEATPGGATLLEVLKLCHRWQLLSLAELLEVKLSSIVTSGNLEAMLEVAVLQNAVILRRACLDAARNSAELEARFRRGEFQPVVQSELQKIFGSAPEPAGEAKKRRVLL